MDCPTPNVMPDANVMPRDPRVGRTPDAAFISQVRGGRAIRMLVADILGRSTPPPSTSEEKHILRVLSREQYEQRHETLRCRSYGCNRVVYGPVQSPDGRVAWKWLVGPECRCGSGA